MNYAILLYDDEQIWPSATPGELDAMMDAHRRFAEAVMSNGGTIVDGHQLQPTRSAMSLRWPAAGDGSTAVLSAGPFAETTEQFGGFYVIDAPDLDAAISWARVLPHHVEIRPTVPSEGPAPDSTSGSAEPGEPADLSAIPHFALLLYGDEESWARATAEQREAMYAVHGRFAASVVAAGASVAGGAELANSTTATTMRRNADGSFVITDGPFAETAEQLTGFYVVAGSGIDLIASLAQGLPGGTTEIRPTVAGG